MKGLDVEAFLSQLTASLEKNFAEYRIEPLFKTPKSFKANIYLENDLFIAVRYNARNERTDFALIRNNQRIFGYDNLKEWHCHPSKSPEKHIPCDKPSIDKIISDIQRVAKTLG
jgi:hypothetical protein